MKRTEDLIGYVITEYTKDDEELILKLSTGDVVKYFHDQDCCEHVRIEDVIGDLDDLLNAPLLMAERITSNQNPEGYIPEYQESFEWTFYKFATIKGYVTIRWIGESNGYYSESVDMQINGETIYHWEQ